MNDALTLIQKQLKDLVDCDEVIKTIYSFLLVDAIFVQPEIAADSVLDTLAVWARVDGQNKDQIKAAAHDLIGFGKHKGMNLIWVALKRADSVRKVQSKASNLP